LHLVINDKGEIMAFIDEDLLKFDKLWAVAETSNALSKGAILKPLCRNA
jgi:hypothetical protein